MTKRLLVCLCGMLFLLLSRNALLYDVEPFMDMAH